MSWIRGPLPATHRLEGILTVLYGDYRANLQRLFWPSNSSSSMRRPLKGEVLWHREYRKEVDIMEQTPEALVSGWNEALRLILSALDEDLTRTLRRQ